MVQGILLRHESRKTKDYKRLKGNRWQKPTAVVELGDLREKFICAENKGFVYEERSEVDAAFLKEAGLLSPEWSAYGD